MRASAFMVPAAATIVRRTPGHNRLGHWAFDSQLVSIFRFLHAKVETGNNSSHSSQNATLGTTGKTKNKVHMWMVQPFMSHQVLSTCLRH